MKHFQRLIEIIDDVLVFGIRLLDNDAHVVVSILVANATKKDGKLFSAVVLLEPSLKNRLRLLVYFCFCHISTCLIDEKLFFLPRAAPQKPQKFLKVSRAGLQLHVFKTFGRLAAVQLPLFKTFGHLAALQRHAPKTFGRRDALGGQQAEGDRPFHRYVGEYS